MLQLPKIKTDPKKTEGLCKCRPICKKRRQHLKNQVQNISPDFLFEWKSLHLYYKRWLKIIYSNGSSYIQSECLTINEKYAVDKSHMARTCQAPVDDTVDTTYLNITDMAMRIGAMDAVRACCAFCGCGKCCPCNSHSYVMHDADRIARRRADMHKFDARVRTDLQHMRIMYDKI